MTLSSTRVTREQAAALAGVSPRQINRWSAAGLISVERDPFCRKPATYDPKEVAEANEGWRVLISEARAARRAAAAVDRVT